MSFSFFSSDAAPVCWRSRLLVLPMALVMALMLPAMSRADEPRLGVELNKLEQSNQTCVAYLIFANGFQQALSKLQMELVFFGGDGLIQRRLTVDAAPLPGAKTTVKLFQIPAMRCESLGSVLLNHVVACERDGVAVPDCIDLLEPKARGSVRFFK